MNIIPIQNKKQNSPSFQMTISCDKQALKILKEKSKKGYLDIYERLREGLYDGPTFDFYRLYKEFRLNFEEATKDKDGRVILKTHPLSKGDLMVSYIGKDGKTCELANGSGAICLPGKSLLQKYQIGKKCNETPFWDSTLAIVDAVGDLFFAHGRPLNNMQVHKQWLEYSYKLASKIVHERFANMVYREDYIEKVRRGVIDDVLMYGIKKEENLHV